MPRKLDADRVSWILIKYECRLRAVSDDDSISCTQFFSDGVPHLTCEQNDEVSNRVTVVPSRAVLSMY